MAFSSDGTKLVSLSGVPDFKIAIWYGITGVDAPVAGTVIQESSKQKTK